MSKPRTLDPGPRSPAAAALIRAWPSVIAALLGAFIVLGVGFAGSPYLHNAAHDSRHTLNFPCH